jgi:hypothetical protein
MGTHNKSKWSQCKGRLVRQPHSYPHAYAQASFLHFITTHPYHTSQPIRLPSYDLPNIWWRVQIMNIPNTNPNLPVVSCRLTLPTQARKSYSCPTTRHEGARGERRYSSYSFPTLTLDGVEWSASRPGRALTPGKGPSVLIVQEA